MSFFGKLIGNVLHADQYARAAYLASLSRWSRTDKPYEIASFHGKNVGGFELITASRTLKALIINDEYAD